MKNKILKSFLMSLETEVGETEDTDFYLGYNKAIEDVYFFIEQPYFIKRIQLCLSKKEVAKRLGISSKKLSKYEKNKKKIPKNIKNKLDLIYKL